MGKTLKTGIALGALLLVLACFAGCYFGPGTGGTGTGGSGTGTDGTSGTKPYSGPKELTRDNAAEALGENYLTKTSVTIPNGVLKLSDRVFTGSTTIKSITIPESVTYIGDDTMWWEVSSVFGNCTALQSISLPSALIYLGGHAFEGCTALETVTIPEDIPSIGDYAFLDCISLKSITFPASIASIGSGMCKGCYSLRSVTIPEGITQIGSSVFQGCRALKEATLPSTVLRIGGSVFADCTALTSVTVLAEIPPEIGGSVFNNTKTGFKIKVPADSVEDYKAQWSGYADLIEAIGEIDSAPSEEN